MKNQTTKRSVLVLVTLLIGLGFIDPALARASNDETSVQMDAVKGVESVYGVGKTWAETPYTVDMTLPFALRFGPFLWWGLLIGATALSLWRMKRKAQRASETITESLKQAHSCTPLRSDEVCTLEGILKIPDGAVLAGQVAPNWHLGLLMPQLEDLPLEAPAGVQLEMNEKVLPLSGMVAVEWGARISGAKAPSARLQSGDSVRLRGRVVRQKAGEVGYRESAEALAIVGSLEEPIRVVSNQAPAPTFRPKTLVVRALKAAAIFALATTAIALWGLKSEIDTPRTATPEFAVRRQLASMHPWTRSDALTRMRDSLTSSPQTPSKQLAYNAILLLQGDCDKTVRSSLRRNYLGLALSLSKRCPVEASADLLEIYGRLGLFEEAADRVEAGQVIGSFAWEKRVNEEKFRGRIHGKEYLSKEAMGTLLLAERYDALASLLLDEAEEHVRWAVDAPLDVVDLSPEKHQEIATELRCAAAVARHLGGDDALQSVGEGTTPFCRLFEHHYFGGPKPEHSDDHALYGVNDLEDMLDVPRRGGFASNGIVYHLQYLTTSFSPFARKNLGALREDVKALVLNGSELHSLLVLAVLEHRLGYHERAFELLTQARKLLDGAIPGEMAVERNEALQAITLTRAALLKNSDPAEAQRLFDSVSSEPRSILRYVHDPESPATLVIQNFKLARNRSGLAHISEDYEGFGGTVLRGSAYSGNYDGSMGYFDSLLTHRDFAMYAQDRAWLDELKEPLRRWETAVSDQRRVPLMLLIDSFRF